MAAMTGKIPALAAPIPPASSSVVSASSLGSAAAIDDLAKRVAEAKQKALEYQSKLAANANPYLVQSGLLLKNSPI